MRICRSSNIWIRVGVVPLGLVACATLSPRASAVTAARAALDIAVNAKIEAKDDFPVPSLSFTSVASKATRYEDLRNELGPLPVLGTIPDCGRHELPHSL